MRAFLLKMRGCTLLALMTATLNGCAAMNQQECRVSDWHTVGFEDGAKGANVTRIGDYREACAKYSVAPDLDSYRSGYALGLQAYCQESNGFRIGSSGGRYEGICPPQLERQYLQGYRPGHQLFELRAGVNNTGGRLTATRNALHENKQRLAEKEAALIEEGTPVEQRAILGTEIYKLSKQQGALENEIVDLERELAARQDELDQFQSTLAYERW
ncbi:MAG: hypothetical protein JWM63_2709 [Gammaproteobacteria bacterium]|jgi:hypothetical protein|nr:hypothetical protein [Gammaproteobacteria bacterium]